VSSAQSRAKPVVLALYVVALAGVLLATASPTAVVVGAGLCAVVAVAALGYGRA
jgi:hypothetical protein